MSLTKTATIPNVSTAIVLDKPSNTLVLMNQSSSTVLYFTLDGKPATTGSGNLQPGVTYIYNGANETISVLTIMGSGGIGNYSFIAHS